MAHCRITGTCVLDLLTKQLVQHHESQQSACESHVHALLQHVGSDADVEANTKLKGLEEKLAAVGQNISSRVKVKELDTEEEEEEGGPERAPSSNQAFEQHRAKDGNGHAEPQSAGENGVETVVYCLPLQLCIACLCSFA